MEELHPEGLVEGNDHRRNWPTHWHGKDRCQPARGLSQDISTGEELDGADGVVELMEGKV